VENAFRREYSTSGEYVLRAIHKRKRVLEVFLNLALLCYSHEFKGEFLFLFLSFINQR